MEKRIGFVGIILEDRERSSEEVNGILSQYGHLIVARLGIPRPNGHEEAVITLVVEATNDEVGALTGKLGAIRGVSVKSALSRTPQTL